MQAQASAINDAGQRMMARAAGLLRIVTDDSILLFAVTRDHRGVPISQGIGRDGVMDHLLARSEPSLNLCGVEIFTEAAKRILAA